MVNAIVQSVQPLEDKVFIETYPNFKLLPLSKDGASHFLYLLYSAYYDPSFTSAPDAKTLSRDYTCDINTDDDVETAVYELKAYFGFFRLQRACETILRFHSYDGSTNFVRCRTG